MLRSFDLVAFAEDEASFRMHRLVQLSTRHWLQIHELLDQRVHAIIQSLRLSFSPLIDLETVLNRDVLSLRQRLLPHVEETLDIAPLAEYVGVDGDVFTALVTFLGVIGRSDKAAETQQKIWQAYVQMKGTHDPATLRQAARLGDCLRFQDKYFEAEILLRDVCHQGEVLSNHNESWYRAATKKSWCYIE